MNYKILFGKLAYQEGKGHQWKEVPYEELCRLAMVGIEIENAAQPRVQADRAYDFGARPCPECGKNISLHLGKFRRHGPHGFTCPGSGYVYNEPATTPRR